MISLIKFKTAKEIKIMREGGKHLADIRDRLKLFTRPGMTLQEIEDKAQVLIKKTGGEPAFARVPGYSWATCLNVNDGFVHGIPNKFVLKDGDVLSIDIGLYLNGFNTDTALSFIVGKIKQNTQKNSIEHFLQTGENTLQKAISVVREGKRVYHISAVIQKEIEKSAYSVSRNLTGHGIGRSLHEAPKIPCFINVNPDQSPILKTGMTIAVEVLYLQGSADTVLDKDRWTIRSKDGKITAVFEKTIAVTADGSIVLT